MKWIPLGRVDPGGLVEARLQLHHAAQLLGIGIGRSLLAARDDDSHTSLVWLDDRWLTAEDPVPGVQVSLRPASLSLIVTRGEVEEAFALPGATLADALAWLGDQLAAEGVDAGRLSLDAHFEIPDHGVARGEAFSTGLGDPFGELAGYYANAATVLDEVGGGRLSAIRTWPHHFDIGGLWLLPELRSGDGKTRSIGLGLSPGDEHFAEPYFYANPWPPPADPQLPELAAGQWHTGSWLGAVLTASELAAAEDQAGMARRFLTAAVEADRRLLAAELG